MPGTNPNLVSGYQPALSPDADALGGANGSIVSSVGSYGASGVYSGLILDHDAINGRKAFRIAPGRALSASLSDDPSPPPGIISGGAFPGGFSAIAVVKFGSLAALPGSGDIPRRTMLGFSGTVRTPADLSYQTGWNVISSSGKLEATLKHHPTSGTWGWDSTPGLGVIVPGSWVILGMRTSGQTSTLWRGRTAERTTTNAFYGAGYSQFINGLTIGADASAPGAYDFDGQIAYLAIYNRAITDNEYRDAFLWLADRYSLPIRDIAVDPVVGVSGKWMFLTLKSAATGEQANLLAQPAIPASTFSYRVDGGSPQTPAQVVATLLGPYSDLRGVVAMAPAIALRLNATATAGQSFTVSISGGVIQTDKGFVDAMADAPVRNAIGDGHILPWDMPASVTMDQGWNIAASYYWTPQVDPINLFHAGSFQPDGSTNGGWTFQVDSDGYMINPRPTERVLLRSTTGDVTPGSDGVRFEYPGIEPGRYVVSWAGPDGANAELVPDLLDAGQTTVTHVPGLDVLTGPRKKRYYDVTDAPGSVRKRLTLAFRYINTAHLTAIDVRHTKYEGETTRKFSDQTVERLSGFRSARFLDLIPINFTNIGRPEDLAPIGQGAWALNSVRTLPAITRIESYGGPYAADLTNVRHLKITFASAHDLSDWQGIFIRSTDGNPINVVLANGTTNLKDDGGQVLVLSSTEVYYLKYRAGEGHAATVTPFTGSNAYADVRVESQAPPEAEAWLVNDAGIPVCHTLIPHTLGRQAGVAAWVTRIANALLPGKKLWVELSNEHWNLGFSQYPAFRGYTCLLTGNPNNGHPSQGYAWRSAQIWDWAKAAWIAAGRDPSDIKLYLGSWYNDWSYTQIIVDWMKANRPDITSFIVGIAPYAFPNCLSQVPGVDYSAFGVAELMDFVEADTLACDHNIFTPKHKAILEASGLDAELHCYEAQQPGFGISPRGPGSGNREQWARHDLEHFVALFHPRMYGVSLKYLKDQQTNGIRVSTIYGYTGGFNYEVGQVGNRTYGEYNGLLQARAAKGDGAGGGPDNLAMIVDGSGNPKWPDSIPLAAPRGAAKQDWQAAFVAGGDLLTASWASVSSPRTGHPDPLSLVFSDPVIGVGIGGVTLTRNGSPVTLTGVTLTGSGTNYTLSGLSSLPATPGDYLLKFSKESGVTTPALVEMASDAERRWTIVSAPSPFVWIESGVAREFNVRMGGV